MVHSLTCPTKIRLSETLKLESVERTTLSMLKEFESTCANTLSSGAMKTLKNVAPMKLSGPEKSALDFAGINLAITKRPGRPWKKNWQPSALPDADFIIVTKER